MWNHLSREFSGCLLVQLKQMKATWVIIENHKKQLQSSRKIVVFRFLKRDSKLYSFTKYN